MHTHDIHTDSDPDITLDNTRHSIMVGDKPVASVVTHKTVRNPDDNVMIARLFVEPEHRGKGLAKRLLNVVSDASIGKRVYTRAHAYGDKPKSDEELNKMYEHLGFAPAVGGKKGLLELKKEARRGMGSMSIMERLVKAALELQVDPPRLHGDASKKGVKFSDVDKDQLAKGIKVEYEHSDDVNTAATIALDHLSGSEPNHKKYYDNPLFKKDLEKKAMLNLVRLICA